MTCKATTETGHECSLETGHVGCHVCTAEHCEGDEGDFIWYGENDGFYLPNDEA